MVKLSPESITTVTSRARCGETIAERLEAELGRDLQESEYDTVASVVDDAVAEALAGVTLDG